MATPLTDRAGEGVGSAAEPHAASRTSDGCDLVVIGAGMGGMAAALVAALEGLNVVLCEATQQVGGTTATSAGTLWMPGNRHGHEAGHGDSVEEAARYLEALIGPDDARGTRRAFLASAGPAVDDLERRTHLAFASAGKHPDYRPLPGAAIAGRALAPLPFDGRLLGADFHRIRPPMPEFMLLGGMMVGKADIRALVRRWQSWPDFLHAARLVARYARDRLTHPRGTRLVMGNALVARLFLSLREAGVAMRFGCSLQALERVDGRVAVVRLRDAAGATQVLRARVGVVLATGGVGHHRALRDELGPAGFEFKSLACESVAGAGIEAARAVGARIEQHRENFLWQPVSVVARPDGSTGLFPHLFLDRAKPGLVAVDTRGRRFVNEAASYHHFVEAMLALPRDAGRPPAWLVCDARFVRRYGLGAIPPGTRRLETWVARGYVHTAFTLEALAGRIGVGVAALQATIDRSNTFARAGRDADFGKGDSEFDRFNGDPEHAPNPCLGPVETPPYCALAMWPADAASSGGLATDAQGRVLGEDDAPIPGLFACGNDAASVMRGSYPGPGTTLGPALAAGWRIGRFAAGARDGSSE
ncbi:FAD-dependent oxidoreductase [Ramlibacter sp. AN1015]|uniref:FAD-dependent oxidoreductase n=1 Tax=Ramlibacter sp. AN1015 TaxID=3133428 RepID=UPI0030BDCB68